MKKSQTESKDSITRSGGGPLRTTYDGRRLLDEAAAERLGDGRGAVRGAEFLEDMLEVGLHGVGRDVQALGDVAVGVPEREQLQDLDRQTQELEAQQQAPQQYAPPPPAAPAAPAGMTDSTIEQLTKLGQLRDSGVLTEEEFQAQKAKILGG